MGMRRLSIAAMMLTPLLLVACGDDADSPDSAAPSPIATPDTTTFVAPSAPKAEPMPPPGDAGPVPLRQTPLGLVGPGGTAPGAPAAAPPPQEPADTTPSEAEVRALYEGIMFTYAFDACGLPLIGERARQNIEQRIEVCPNPALRKDAFRTVYHRAIEVAQQDPEKTRASASRACPDKPEFLRRVMSHSSELTFDDSQPPDCSLISGSPPGAAPPNPAAGAPNSAKGEKPF